MSDKYSTIELRVSYGVGRQMGEQLASNPFDGVDANAVAAGGIDALSGKPGEVEASILQSLGWFTCILITVLATTAFLFTRRIRLSRADHDKVRTQLAARANPEVAPANP